MDIGRRINILGVGVHPLTMDDALAFIEDHIRSRDPAYICLTPIHAIMDCYDQPDIRPVYNASGLTAPDGMGVVWLLKLLGARNTSRVYGPDLLLETCKVSQPRPYRHFFYGGTPQVLHDLQERLTKSYPGMNVAGSYSPPFRDLTGQEEVDVVLRIKEAAPDIVWVGIGSPRQELWMARHVSELSVPILAGVGAAFDFHSGNKPQAPIWMQRSCLEWLFRFISEPRRLFRRYMVNYPRFIILIIAQLLGIINIPMK